MNDHSDAMESTLDASVLPMIDSRSPPARGDLALEADRARVFGALFGKSVRRRFGRYMVLDVLGHGGMGVVFEGYDEELERPVAIKVLHEHLGPQHTARLRREAQGMAKLSHPHVVQVYEVGEVEGRAFVAMELVKGHTVEAWMQQAPRPGWRACVKVFLQLGEGLAAAHAQGLVHRDFKPGNAIIDEQGRARVLDFGLVRRGDEGDEAFVVTEATRGESQATAMLDQSLTRTGAIMGTPAYMPLEQMSGAEVDACSDQFSFCVALYEAVYGERPYEGDSLPNLMVSMQRGVVRAPPKGSTVPAGLRVVLLRGLASEARERWPSMEALLEQLRRVVAPRSRRLILVSLAVASVGLAGSWAFAQYVQTKDRCTGAQANLASVWDDGRKQEVKAAILGTGLSYAEGTWERVEQRLDDYADRWASKHVAVCEATSVREEQSAEVMDLRMKCLEDRRVALRATVGVLADADATVVENAVKLATGLPGLQRCDDVEALRAEVPPPEDPQVAQRVQELRERLEVVRAEGAAGRHQSALEEAERVVTQAEALGHEPLVAEAKYWRGSKRDTRGQYVEAEADLREAYALAIELRHDEVALHAAQKLTMVVGDQQARPAEGHVWGVTAMAHAERSRTNEELSSASNSLGAVLFREGKYEQATLHFERALQLDEQALGADHPRVSNALNNLGVVLLADGKHEQAKLHLERAVQVDEQALGADHPDVASKLSNLGLVLEVQGKHEQAKRHYERALWIDEQALGADHPDVAGVLNNLGLVLQGQGKYEQAKLHYQRALRIREKVLGADHPDVARVLNNLGKTLGEQGEHEQAKRHYERALRIREKALGADHPDVASSLTNLGYVLGEQGELELARRHFERALRIGEKALGADHPDVASSLANLGALLREQGELEQAKLLCERALQIYEKALGANHPGVASPLLDLAEIALVEEDFESARAHAERAVLMREQGEVAPDLLASARFTLAEALWHELAERPRARALAQQAREAYAELGADEDLAEVERWLQANP